jgi:5'-nucleotidase
MAISINTFGEAHWDTAAQVARAMALKLHKHGMPEDTLLNVNVPNIPMDEVKGYRVTRMGRSRFFEVFHKRNDPRGNEYYWMDGEMTLLDADGGTDVEALQDGYVSLTPIGLDLTRYEAMDHLKSWGLD